MLLKGSKLAVSMKERQRQRTQTHTDGGLLYWPYSDPHLVLLRLPPPQQVVPRAASALIWLPFSLTWLTDWLNDHSVYGYPCIYNFITSICSSYPLGCQPTWPASVFLLLTQLKHLVLEIPNWRVCQRSISNPSD